MWAVLFVLISLLASSCSSDSASSSSEDRTVEDDVAVDAPPEDELAGASEEFVKHASSPAVNGQMSVAEAAAAYGPVASAVRPVVPGFEAEGEAGRTESIIRIGGVATETRAGKTFRKGRCAGAIARLQQAAADDRLPAAIEWLGCEDDEARSSNSSDAVEDLMAKGAFAVVPLASESFFTPSELNNARIPYVGAGSTAAFCGLDNRFGFGVGGAQDCPVLSVAGRTAVTHGMIRPYVAATGVDPVDLDIAVVVDASERGREALRSHELEAAATGAALVHVDQSLEALGRPSEDAIAAVADGVVTSGADLVIVDTGGTPELYQAISESRFAGDLIGLAYSDSSQLEADPALAAEIDGSFQVLPAFALEPDGGPAWLRVLGAASFDDDEATLGFLEGYVSVDLFLAAIEDLDEPLTRERVHDLINSGWVYQGLEGVVCASSWPEAHLVASPCASVLRVTSGSLEQVLPLTTFEVLVE